MSKWSDWDAESHGFIFEPGVGLTVDDAHWLSWDETLALAKWLAEKVSEAEAQPEPQGEPT